MGAPKQQAIATPFNPLTRQAEITSAAPPMPSLFANLVADHVKKGMESLSEQIGTLSL